ncbi:MAG: ABC transporter ATP-binding protein [Gemmatimonadales bacterium]|nr:ABC transporter ATP-binding protein [Gemmatimonadales bacterium]
MSDDPAVEAQGLVRRFGDDAALHEVSFDVAPGELYGIIGPDGAGKTTLFRILVTLLLPDAGTARVLGRDVVKDLWNLRSRIGYMPGRFSLYPDLSVAENLGFFAALFDTTIAEARETIAPIWVQLEQFAARRAGALSGGMKQKLALCCALVHRPEILFLDEPTTGVDAVSRKEFWDLLARLRDEGLPIVVSTPYMDEAIRCDRVSLMQGGRLLVTDRPAEIGRGYPRPLLAVRGSNILGLLGALRGFPHAAAVWPFGEALHYTDARRDAQVEQITRELAAHVQSAGLSGVSMSPIAASIEDAFMWYMAQEQAA